MNMKVLRFLIIVCITKNINAKCRKSTLITETKQDAWTKLKSDDAIKMLTPSYQAESFAGVKKLEWTCDGDNIFKLSDFIRILNFMPNLVELKLIWWTEHFMQDNSTVDALNLPNLTSLGIIDCNSFLIDTFLQVLPRHTLSHLKVNGVTEEVIKNFLANQQSIKRLDIEADIKDIGVFEHLKLTELRYAYTPKKYHEQNPVSILKNFIRTQPDLVSLDCLEKNTFTTPTIDDEVFLEICDSKKLETLKVNVDGVSPNNIQHISKLSNLKSLWIKANYRESMGSFRQLSFIKNIPIKHLHLDPYGYEISARSYQRMGENFNLKSLKIALGTKHSINFYMKAFPTVEKMSIRFGEANNRVEFSQVYTEDHEKHLNMKHLKLKFHGDEMVNTEKFFEMLKSFPNLESFEVSSKIPFTPDFFGQLINNLGKIKALKMNSFEVRNNEKFPPEIIKALKDLRGKLQKCYLKLANVQRSILSSVGEDEDVDTRDPNFTFLPLVEAMKDDFNTCVNGFSKLDSYKFMEMDSGFE